MSTAPVLESSVKAASPAARAKIAETIGVASRSGRDANARAVLFPPSAESTVTEASAASATWAALDQAIHLWVLPPMEAPGATSLAELSTLLAAEEHARAASFHFAQHRDAFVANRGRLRIVLSHYLDCLPWELQFVQGPHGKPAIVDRQSRGLTFNLSHTEDLAVLAVARQRQVGIDVEQLKPVPDLLELGRLHFSPEEYQQLADLSSTGLSSSDLPSTELITAFYTCWTRKEAFLKGLGTGLARNLAEFQVSLLPGRPAELLACQWSPQMCQSWRLHSLDLGDRYQGALAYEQLPQHSPIELRTFTWSVLDNSAQDR